MDNQEQKNAPAQQVEAPYIPSMDEAAVHALLNHHADHPNDPNIDQDKLREAIHIRFAGVTERQLGLEPGYLVNKGMKRSNLEVFTELCALKEAKMKKQRENPTPLERIILNLPEAPQTQEEIATKEEEPEKGEEEGKKQEVIAELNVYQVMNRTCGKCTEKKRTEQYYAFHFAGGGSVYYCYSCMHAGAVSMKDLIDVVEKKEKPLEVKELTASGQAQ